MSDDWDDLDALFDAVVAQKESTASASPPATAEPAAPAEDDLDALFEAAAAQQVAAPAEPAALAAEPQPADSPELAAAAAALHDEGLPLYQRLGLIVRELHDALRQLGQDRALFDAVHEMFDSQERLKYIASLTEQAANKVLNAVDESLPAQDAQVRQAQEMSRRWQAMFEGQLSLEDFKQLAADSRDFSALVVSNAEAEKARLMDIMMAQDFQDITGQIIKKVVTLTGNLESQLTQLLRDFAPTPQRSGEVDLLSGPNVPTASMVQTDVDSLLGDLGF